MTKRNIGSQPPAKEEIIPSEKPVHPGASKQVESHRQATGEKVAETLKAPEFSDTLSPLIALFTKYSPLNENDISALKVFDRYLNASSSTRILGFDH